MIFYSASIILTCKYHAARCHNLQHSIIDQFIITLQNSVHWPPIGP